MTHRRTETALYKALLGLLTVGLIIAGVGYYNESSAADRWLMDIEGGQAPCCKNCHNWSETIWECGHYNTDVNPIPCQATWCIGNVINTDLCDPGGAAVACKTKDAAPVTPVCLQTKYNNIVNCPFGADNTWTNLVSIIGGNACADLLGGPVRVACRGTVNEAKCKTAGTPDKVIVNKARLGNKQVCN